MIASATCYKKPATVLKPKPAAEFEKSKYSNLLWFSLHAASIGRVPLDSIHRLQTDNTDAHCYAGFSSSVGTYPAQPKRWAVVNPIY